MEKVIEVFYNFLPGLFYLSLWIIIFYNNINKFLQSYPILENLSRNELVAIVLGLSFFLITSYILHGLLQIYKKNRNLAKDEDLYRANRWLWFKGKQNLSEFHCSRSAFFGNMFVGSFATLLIFFIALGIKDAIHVKGYWFVIFIGLMLLFHYLWRLYRYKHKDTAKKMYNEFSGRILDKEFEQDDSNER